LKNSQIDSEPPKIPSKIKLKNKLSTQTFKFKKASWHCGTSHGEYEADNPPGTKHHVMTHLGESCTKDTLQHTATHCNTLQNTALKHTATHYNTLQHTATHCNTLIRDVA